MAATASIPTATPTPIPAFVPSVMFDMVVVEQMPRSGSIEADGRSDSESTTTVLRKGLIGDELLDGELPAGN